MWMKVQYLAGIVFISSFLIVSIYKTTVASAQNIFTPIMLAKDDQDSEFAIIKWLAFGSGCRAVNEVEVDQRDVNLKVIPKNKSDLTRLQLVLHLPDFNLKSGHNVEKNRAREMYSECALRFAIKGQKGRRLKKIKGLSELQITKEKGVKILILNELKFGRFGESVRKFQYDENSEIKNLKLALNLSEEFAEVAEDGSSSCGSDQILNFDYTFFATKTGDVHPIKASIQIPQQAYLTLEYADCKIPHKTSNKN
jgi:hypothetical protein